ncbi:hypothetical protein [Cyanobacterium sp. Dongsha4]|uniref:hypothetical protein n=1 Tax=Cyanobacterium sp. DS4 TaxID=2878255 RepID=UPI002E8237A0|nr:hypothetical protein [Cyanobacterium sp. Dongsha4]WVL00645.1 hypothetical protein Dongsha4_00130 [Cyanobacterium sp. Dongsha4]
MTKVTVSKARIFEEEYPYISRFVQEQGKIEVGYAEGHPPFFVVAYDEGGTIFEGKEEYNSMDKAFADLENGIKEFMEKNGL